MEYISYLVLQDDILGQVSVSDLSIPDDIFPQELSNLLWGTYYIVLQATDQRVYLYFHFSDCFLTL